MIGRPLLKLIAVIVVLGLVAFELGSPLITRIQVDSVASDAADNGAQSLYQTRSPDDARRLAEQVVIERDAELKGPVEVDPTSGTVKLTVMREAKGLLLKKWSKTRSWYEVEVSASSSKTGV